MLSLQFYMLMNSIKSYIVMNLGHTFSERLNKNVSITQTIKTAIQVIVSKRKSPETIFSLFTSSLDQWQIETSPSIIYLIKYHELIGIKTITEMTRTKPEMSKMLKYLCISVQTDRQTIK